MKFTLKMMKIINIKNQLLHCATIDFIIFEGYTNIDGKSLLKLNKEYFDKSVNFTIYIWIVKIRRLSKSSMFMQNTLKITDSALIWKESQIYMFPTIFKSLTLQCIRQRSYRMAVIKIFSQYITSNDDVFYIVDIALFILKRTSNQ